MTRRVKFSDESVTFAGQSSLVDDDVASSTIQTKSSWYRSKDYLNFLLDRRRTAEALREVHGEGSRLDAARYCLRGLECVSGASSDDYHPSCSSYSRERRSQQSSIIRMVLDAQHEQRQRRIQNHDNIRARSMVLSKVSRDRAIEVAALDAAAVTAADDEDREHLPCNASAEPLLQQQQQQQSPCLESPSLDHSVVHSERQGIFDPPFGNRRKRRPMDPIRLCPGRSKRRSHDSHQNGQQKLGVVEKMRIHTVI